MRTTATLASLLTLAALAMPRAAHAQGPEAPPAAAPAPPTVSPDTASGDVNKDFKPVAITLNPLGLVLGRVSVNAEYLPVPHHAIVVNPFFQSISVNADTLSTSYTSFGGELGYHYYTGHKGANGFYVGPSLVVMSSTATTKDSSSNSEASASIFSYGAAVDVGAQHVFDSGFTIGGGAGAMYLLSSNTTTQTSSTVKFAGVLPRFLFTAGWSF